MKNKINKLNGGCCVGAVLGSLLVLSGCSTIQSASSRPHIILITTDDLGYMDVQEYAHHITGEKKRRMYNETPNLDRLCSEGLSFEQAYACRLQLPGTSGILNGRVNAACSPVNGGSAGDAGEGVSIAGVLPDYDSAFIGHWLAAGTPAAAGFKHAAVTTLGGQRGSAELSAQALLYLEGRSRMRNQPFFLYLNHSAAESAPASAADKDVAYFSKKGTRGWQGQSDPQHAARVKALDDALGRILHKLWRTGLDKKSVVIFMPVAGRRGAELAASGSGVRVPLIIRWNKYVTPGSWSKVPVDYADILPTVMQCAGYLPETLSDAAGVDGCSLSGLFWDPQNKSASYEREMRRPGYSCTPLRSAISPRL